MKHVFITSVIFVAVVLIAGCGDQKQSGVAPQSGT